MKVITLIQPWATLVMLDEKRIETRSWATQHRGKLAIHAGKNAYPAYKQLCQTEPFRSILAKHGITNWDELPRGVILGTAHLDDCTMVDLLPRAMLTPLEMAFGDYTPGRYGWLLSAPTPLVVPVACKGKLGLFDIEDEVLCEGA
jgi:hypothetical protein